MKPTRSPDRHHEPENRRGSFAELTTVRGDQSAPFRPSESSSTGVSGIERMASAARRASRVAHEQRLKNRPAKGEAQNIFDDHLGQPAMPTTLEITAPARMPRPSPATQCMVDPSVWRQRAGVAFVQSGQGLATAENIEERAEHAGIGGQQHEPPFQHGRFGRRADARRVIATMVVSSTETRLQSQATGPKFSQSYDNFRRSTGCAHCFGALASFVSLITFAISSSDSDLSCSEARSSRLLLARAVAKEAMAGIGREQREIVRRGWVTRRRDDQ